MTRAQTLFVIGLSVVALIIVGFSLYVLSSTRWAQRWYSSSRSDGPLGPSRSRSDGPLGPSSSRSDGPLGPSDRRRP